MGFARRSVAPALVVAALTTFLFLRTFVDPRTPVLLGGDQGFFWMYADRMLHGELPYRDFFQFTLPGADLVHVAAFALFGARVWVTDALVVVLGGALAALSLIVARRIMSDGAAALASSVLVVLVFGQALTTTHHWWSTLFVLAAVATLDEGKKDRQWALAGVLLGLAMFCTQTHGGAALVAFVVFAYARKVQVVRRILLVVGSSVATLLGLMAYFVATVGLRAVWRCTGSYVMSTMASTSSGGGLGLPEALTSRSLPALLPHLVVYAMLPIAYLVLPRVKAAREGSSTVRARRLLLWVVGSILALEVLSSLSWVRVFGVAWPAVILVVAWIAARAASRRPWVALAWVGIVGLGMGLVRSTHRHHASRALLPGEQLVAVDAERRAARLSLRDEPREPLPPARPTRPHLSRCGRPEPADDPRARLASRNGARRKADGVRALVAERRRSEPRRE